MDVRTSGLIDHAHGLERKDESLAASIDRLSRLAARVDGLREDVRGLGLAMERLPEERAAAQQALEAAKVDGAAAASAVTDAERRLAELEGSRRRKLAEVDQALRELRRAREAMVDAETRAARHAQRGLQLDADETAGAARIADLVGAAHELAAAIGEAPRVPDAGSSAPGVTLPELEDWGGQARAALFVARGGLETERARLVDEANALGSAVLGEPLGASSVALIRRRVVERASAGSVSEGD